MWALLGLTLRPAIYRRNAELERMLRLDLELTRDGVVPPLFGFGLFQPR